MGIGATIVSAAYRAGWAAAATMPYPLTQRIFESVSDALVRRRGPAVRQLARNLKRVLGASATPTQLHAVTGAAMRSYGRYWLETFTSERADRSALAERALAATIGLHHVRAAQEAGQGIILALPHSGNWDIAGLSMSHVMGEPIMTVAERLTPESLYRRFTRYRDFMGITVLPMSGEGGGAAHNSAALQAHLRQGGMVCLLADRDLAGNGIPVRFFGADTTFPAGPALLAARTGAALCPVHLSYTAHGFLHHIGAPLTLRGSRLAQQVRDGVTQLAAFFAEYIALYPADWHMLQPLWLADRPHHSHQSAKGG